MCKSFMEQKYPALNRVNVIAVTALHDINQVTWQMRFLILLASVNLIFLLKNCDF